MDKPDERLFEDDLSAAEFRAGADKGKWGLPSADLIPEKLDWPKRIFWIAADLRDGAPDRFYVALDAEGYRRVSPTGSFWNPLTKSPLDPAKWPKGKPGSRFAKVFRTDWKGGIAFYHPYDRAAAQGHNEWPNQQPHLVWTSNHTIVDYLDAFHTLLTGGDYVGV